MKQNKITSNMFTYIVIFALMAVSVAALSAVPVDLRTAGNFTILSKAQITDVNPSVITGDVGASPITGASIHVSCSEVSGTIWQVNDAYTGGFDTNTACVVSGTADAEAGKTYVDTAVLDMGTAYAEATTGQTAGTGAFLDVEAGTLGIPGTSQIFVPGVYTWGSDVTIPNDIYLDGSSTDIWVFQISGTLDISSNKQVHLTGGALAKNVFWAVTGVTALGTGSVFEGNILTTGTSHIALLTGATLHGRALSDGEVWLQSATVTAPPAAPLPPMLATITLIPTAADLTVGSALLLNTTTLDQYSDPIAAEVNYTSNDTAIATVSTSGLITAIAAGNATITASSGAISATSNITVETVAPILNKISYDFGTRTVTQGNWLNFTVTATSPGGFNLTFDLSGKPAAATFTDNGDGTAVFSWMPDAADVGATTVNFTVTDGMKFASEAVTMIVNEFQAPTISQTTPSANGVVDLGTAGNFAILAQTGVSDATPADSNIAGSIGVDPAAGSFISGTSCTNVAGTIYDNNAGYTGGYDSNVTCLLTDPVLVLTARRDMQIAYTDAAGRTNSTATELYSGNLGGRTLTPGVYKWSTGVTIPTDVTLSGGTDDVWIFQIAQTLDISPATKVNLIGGAQAKNIFWQVAGQATLGTTSVFNGNILGKTAIVLNTGAALNGRALAQTEVTLDANNVSVVAAAVATTPPVWKNEDFSVTLSATGLNDTPIAYINYSLNNVTGQIIGGIGNVLINISGNNTLIYYAVDTSGNVGEPTTIYALLDKVDPQIASFTLSPSSVTVGNTITGACTATDNLDPNPAKAITGIDTTTAGSKTATCTATDFAGNSVTASASYTVSAASSGGGGGGGGGASNWPCTEWSACSSDGISTQVCTKPGSNGDITSADTKSCTPSQESQGTSTTTGTAGTTTGANTGNSGQNTATPSQGNNAPVANDANQITGQAIDKIGTPSWWERFVAWLKGLFVGN